MCPLKREQATRVSYNTLTHSRLYCRDREKKQVMNCRQTYTLPKLPLPRTLTKWKSSMQYFLTVGRRRAGLMAGRGTLLLSSSTQIMLIRAFELVAVERCLSSTLLAVDEDTAMCGSEVGSWLSGISITLLVALLRIS